MQKPFGPVIHVCPDFLAILRYVNSEIEENRHDSIVSCLDSHYHRMSRNVPPESRWLFSDEQELLLSQQRTRIITRIIIRTIIITIRTIIN